MYYTNVDSTEEHLAFIGRWCPLHEGHTWIIEQKLKETNLPVLILIRNTSFDEINAETRAYIVMTWMKANDIKGSIVIIPDIKGVYYGRGVGYEIEEMIPPEKLKIISATIIREMIEYKNDGWKSLVADGTQEILENIYRKV